jgi:CDGSH-type Zn-finger protein
MSEYGDETVVVQEQHTQVARKGHSSARPACDDTSACTLLECNGSTGLHSRCSRTRAEGDS